MKHLRKQLIAAIGFILLFGLFGCSSENIVSNTNSKEVSKESVKDKKEAKQIKNELLSKVAEAEKDNQVAIKKRGYLEAEEYVLIRNKINFIAEATKTAKKIDMNDNDTVKEVINKTKAKIKSMSNRELLKSKGNLQSGKVFYTAVVMEELHQVMKTLDFNDSEGELSGFLLVNDDSTDTKQIIESAKTSVNNLQDYTLASLVDLSKEVKDHEKNFNKEELKFLNSVLRNLQSSGEKQVQILKQFNVVSLNDGTTLEDNLDSANIDFEDAQKALSKFETKLGIDYVEPEV